jgi:nitrogen fixation-related uncharacterized protein
MEGIIIILVMVGLLAILAGIKWYQFNNEYKFKVDLENRLAKLESECHKH